ISSSPSSIQVQIAPLSAVPTPESLALEHSDFTLQFIPVRSDSGLAAPTAESITLRYNTPPRMPLEVVYNKDSQQLDWMGSEGWKLVQQAHDSHLDNHIYWAWPRGITYPRHPDYVTKFQIYVDGSLSQEGAPDNFKYTDSTFISPKLADYQVYRVAGTSGSKIEIYAVDPEDVTSFATGSGIAPHKITLTTDQGFFSSSGVDSLEVYKAAGSLAIGSDFEAPYNSDTRYYLSGWTCDGNPVSFPLEISKSMKLVAQWTSYPTDGGTGGTPGGDSEGITGSGSASSSTYSITYDANGADSGTVPASQTKLAGKTVTLAKNSGNLTKEHHTFSGWNTQADGKGQFYGEGTTYATDANVTLYAQWTKWNQVEPVHFDVGAGNVNFNTQVTLSTATPNATIHYTVNGSGEQIGAVGQPVVITIISDATISAYATYDGMIPSTETSANYKLYTYTITYDGNGADGGTVPVQQTKIDGYPVELAGNTDNLTKTGYTFDGWNTAADGTGTSYAEGASYTKDAALTLYAQWKGVDYTITYDLDGGTNHSGSPQGYTVADLPLELKTPTKTGYTFKGWLIGDSSSPGTRIEQGVTGDITVTAQWQLNTYTVIFNGNNSTSGSTSSQIFTYGISQNLTPNGFQRTGYTFVDWNTAADGTGTSYANGASYAATGDITLYAQWKVNIISALTGGQKTVTLESRAYSTAELKDIANAIKNDSNNTQVTLDCSNITVENNVFPNLFQFNKNIVGIIFPDTITTIGGWGFQESGLRGPIDIPASVTSIEASAFSTTEITEVRFATVPQVESIGNNAFNTCKNLTSIDLPATVTTIGSWAFYGCSGITIATVRYTGTM
ncbi:MAG: InlB B-repeat-containing protein, partial [Spirochaetaceae bacterium]|nr:InlB B-repeat-containing protein [Spirochaetaceae bacterium]